MKKLACMLLALILLPVYALAEVDLSAMTYDELVALRDQINLAIWNSAEWQEVEVPQGVWKVGEDIPAGRWVVKCAPGWRRATVNWGEYLDSTGEDIDWAGTHSLYNYVFNPDHDYYKVGDGVTEYEFAVEDGMYIVIDDASVIFMPYHGKPSLGFK